MILKRYGTTYQSVDLHFDSKALNEVGFRRNRQHSVPVEELEETHERSAVHELEARAEGDVQDHTEQVLLDRLEAEVEELRAGLGDGEMLVVENEDGHDYPKTRQKTSNVVVEGENKLRFVYTVAPPLRVAVWKPRG